LAETSADLVVMARIGAAHGIRGQVRVKSFAADPASLRAFGPLQDWQGRRFEIASLRPLKDDMLVVGFKGVSDRNAAETLNGVELLVPREKLPAAEEDEFYYADLIGLDAFGADGAVLGSVVAILNHGAGDIIEIAPRRGPTLLVPFTKEAVPEIDIAARRVVVVPPPETEARADEDLDAEPGSGETPVDVAANDNREDEA
jgi:16S rRNA processing protein RimM